MNRGLVPHPKGEKRNRVTAKSLWRQAARSATWLHSQDRIIGWLLASKRLSPLSSGPMALLSSDLRKFNLYDNLIACDAAMRTIYRVPTNLLFSRRDRTDLKKAIVLDRSIAFRHNTPF